MSALNWRPPLRDDLAGQEPYGAPQLQVPVRLNVNENPYGPSPALANAMAQAVERAAVELNRYPDRELTELRGSLARYLSAESDVQLSPEQMWAANGSNEIMQQLLQAFGGPGRTAMSFAPTYSMYPEYARNTHTRWVCAPRNEDFSLDEETMLSQVRAESPAVVIVPSPNNPTGTALPPAIVARLCDALPHGIVVIDEAYAEFRRSGVPSATTELGEHPNLVVTRTMSKAFALAGGRVGYLAADPRVCEALQIVRLPYHLSTVTQAVACVALAHSRELLERVDDLRVERDQLVVWLRSQGHEVAESDANFVLFGRFADRHAVWQGLLERGVLIREVGPDGWLRVSVGTPDEMATFREALPAAVAPTLSLGE